MNNICIFCGSNSGRSAAYTESARAMVAAIGEAGMGIVFGGGNIGLMGVIAETALARGVRTVGITPRRLLEREVVHTGLDELHVVESMQARKAMMREHADAFVALPGGLGTLDELFEVAALTQLGEHRKPCGLLNAAGFFDGLRTFLDHAVNERFVTPVHRDMLVVESDPRQLIAALRAWSPAQSSKWIDRQP
jgi:uncharacterized protein (TIGR00730 family)